MSQFKEGNIVEITYAKEPLDKLHPRIGGCSCPQYWVLRESNTNNIIKTTMTNLTQKFRLLTKSEPEKTFIEKGIMTVNEELTAEGKDLFSAFMFEKHKAEFKTEVVDKLTDEEAK